MKSFILSCLLSISIFSGLQAQQSETLRKDIQTLIVRVDDDWERPPVADMDKNEHIVIRFDQLSHDYHRFEYVIRHCNADWKPSSLNEIDYLRGFNNNPIEEYSTSINTIMEYTHYTLRIPNEQVQLTQSGNYEVLIYDEDDGEHPVAIARFALQDNKVRIAAQVSGNTDIDFNQTHQQVSLSVSYKGLTVRNPQQELKLLVRQNRRIDNQVNQLNPSYVSDGFVRYEHNRNLIFDAGNEYRKFEMLSYYHDGMGIDKIARYGDYYHATLYVGHPRTNYIYDEDQDGAFLIRCDNSSDPNTEADYMLVHFAFDDNNTPILGGDIYVQGEFTSNALTEPYRMAFNKDIGCYESIQLMKQGFYNYQYVFKPSDGGKVTTQPTEGNFYQTENQYEIYVYYRPFGARADSLVGFLTIKYKQ